MVSIQIDEQTAQALEMQAQKAGVSLTDYLRSLVSPAKKVPDWDEIAPEIDALSFDGPTLPPDFSRADMYDDHD
jgi:hypothetical protein